MKGQLGRESHRVASSTPDKGKKGYKLGKQKTLLMKNRKFSSMESKLDSSLASKRSVDRKYREVNKSDTFESYVMKPYHQASSKRKSSFTSKRDNTTRREMLRRATSNGRSQVSTEFRYCPPEPQIRKMEQNNYLTIPLFQETNETEQLGSWRHISKIILSKDKSKFDLFMDFNRQRKNFMTKGPFVYWVEEQTEVKKEKTRRKTYVRKRSRMHAALKGSHSLEANKRFSSYLRMSSRDLASRNTTDNSQPRLEIHSTMDNKSCDRKNEGEPTVSIYNFAQICSSIDIPKPSNSKASRALFKIEDNEPSNSVTSPCKSLRNEDFLTDPAESFLKSKSKARNRIRPQTCEDTSRRRRIKQNESKRLDWTDMITPKLKDQMTQKGLVNTKKGLAKINKLLKMPKNLNINAKSKDLAKRLAKVWKIPVKKSS
ncbi:unnamed protein product [Moneuplotes crassus]|uniref:Uncharacterized protein n=1 Tax=Euplotes crassus TaxID=5936 RepID=A0AAD1U197_EUPCR|nr:unnamed protein product [Moneuplotes crassus]